ncbi:MAG: hypothetical protein ACREQ5_26770 [Candidatus Dormibacteria bacterium]
MSDDGFNRWSQVVRDAGAVEILGHQPISVPPLGSEQPVPPGRRGVRLLCRPVAGAAPHYTIDVTATAAIAMLEPWLQSGNHVGKVLTWSARGFGVRRRDTLRLTPIGLTPVGGR